jgi:hypothetical protein
MMFRRFADDDWGGPPDPEPLRLAALPAGEAMLIWGLRRLALLRPIGSARCHALHIALHQGYGDAGLGIEHLLRCLLVGLARRTDRPLGLGQPACPLLTRDEVLLLAAFTGDPGPGLARLAGPQAAALAPLLRSLKPMLKNIS